MSIILNRLNALFHPEQYHGWGRTRRFFEGWYFKVVNREEDQAFAFIPGIAMNDKGERHAFVQVLDGKKLTSEYHSFPEAAFHPADGRFDIEIAGNRFNDEKILLDLPGIRGELNFRDHVKWPDRWYSPGIMGPFAFVPFMECYHGVLSMYHAVEGTLHIDDHDIDFSGGLGYSEKDWGHSFPSAYIWMQTNHFSRPDISLKVSVAKIPWLKASFTGFIAGLWCNNRFFTFTTYNGSRLVKVEADREKAELVVENRSFRLEIMAWRNDATALASPIAGFMEGRISESMTSVFELRLTDVKNGEVLLDDNGRNVALEVAGKIEEIMMNKG
jgi:tocopherol cyclase